MKTAPCEIGTLQTVCRESDLRTARRAVRHFAEQLPFDTRQVAEITLAVAEACVNGVRHGHIAPEREHECIVTVQATPMEDHLAIEVIDHGGGFHAAPPEMPGPYAESGRGLAIMFALMDQVAIESSQNGTHVRMVKYFGR